MSPEKIKALREFYAQSPVLVHEWRRRSRVLNALELAVIAERESQMHIPREARLPQGVQA
jgi:hypothetical protein